MKFASFILFSVFKNVVKVCLILTAVYFFTTLVSRNDDENLQNPEELLRPELPAFYFSVLPGWYVPELSRLPNSDLKKAGISLLRRGWTFTEWRSAQKEISVISSLPGYESFEQLRYESNPAVLTGLLTNLENAHRSISTLPVYQSLSGKIRRVPERITVHWYPKLYFWSTENYFHRKVLAGETSVGPSLREAIPGAFSVSLILGVFTFIFSLLAGSLWALAYMRSKPFTQKLLFLLMQVFYILPVFCVAILVIQFFSTDQYGTFLHWIPAVGSMLTIPAGTSLVELFFRWSGYLILPAMLIALPLSAGIAIRWINGLETEQKNLFFTVLRSKGLHPLRRFMPHLIKNAALPMTIYFSMLLPALVSGSIIIEQIFAIPGLGRLTLQAVMRQDMALLILITGLLTVICLMAHKVGTILLYRIDPRIRFSSSLNPTS